ncbi:putative maltose permease [Talaromyces proteolyticus]|uniref:Maltose permease n=1 Tax=Talaromyces proteolyticus TaxID=1131652 RepID=A0AAD4KJA6_9EURO|nr:putative maltose permease [Talaromyces proteolyticus]KAH8690617.1 putative maltose permease [Talaromyces proteolyticus]
MTLLEGLKRYPKAAFWSIFISTAVIMEGYDIGLLGSFYGFPAFQKKYGEMIGNNKYNISAPWQSGLTQAMHVGQIFGLMINGWAMDRYGFKKTQIAALLVMSGFIFIQFFAQSIVMLLVGELLIGFPLGIFLTLSTVYAAEVCPVVLRPYLTTYVNLCWSIGKYISTGVLRGFIHNETQWAYKIPFAIQWVWVPWLVIGTLLAPESPWWFVRQGRLADARKSLRRLWTNPQDHELDVNVGMMVATDKYERSIDKGTSYLDCFKGSNLRRTEIACIAWSIQPMCGFALAGQATYFLEQAGLDSTNAFNMSLGSLSIGFVGGIIAWLFVNRFGRRPLYVYGLAGIFIVQMIIGFLAIPKQNSGTAWATGVMPLVFTAIYSVSVGPACYAIVAEVPSTRLRAKTTALARNAYNIFSIINNIITNYQVNATAWNWKGFTGFFWAGFCVLCWVWSFYRLPELKDRTFSELDVLFETKVSARKFKGTVVDNAVILVEGSN